MRSSEILDSGDEVFEPAVGEARPNKQQMEADELVPAISAGGSRSLWMARWRGIARGRWHAALRASLAGLLGFVGLAHAQDGDRAGVGEYQVKAAFLYHFAKFVEWPPAARNKQAIAVCILGSDPFGPALDFLLEDKTLRGKRFDVRRLSQTAEARSCHLLFVSLKDQHELQRAVQALGDSPVLTVGDSPHFLKAGGMISLFLDESKIRFDVSLAAARQSRITISAPLLRLARNVDGH